MMYSEFINLTGKTESYISYVEYTTFIEPIYMDCDIPNKFEFCKLFNELHKQIVCPVIEKAIHTLSSDERNNLIFNNSTKAFKLIESKDFEARKIMYQYLKLMANI